MIPETELIDVGFQGPAFTWQRGNLLERLDRVLINLDQRIKFQNAWVIHFSFFKSDHRPALIKMTYKRDKNKRKRSFRFMASWLMHEDFNSFIKTTWNPDVECTNRIQTLQEALHK